MQRICLKFVLLSIIFVVLFYYNLSAQVTVTIGSGDQQALIPFNFYFYYSLYETLYYPNEIQTAGLIEAIQYYNNFNQGNLTQNVQVWMGETTQTDLSQSWIPSSQLTQVYDGPITFPNGQNTINIPFSTPFSYTGNNLVVMTRNPYMSAMIGPQYFNCQTVGTNRARNYYSDTNNPDPANPPTTGSYLSVTGLFPKTTLVFLTNPPQVDLGIANLNGNVTPTRGVPSNYTVDVHNAGLQSVWQYTVKLYDSNHTLLSSVAHDSIASGQTQTVTIAFTPTVVGAMSIYAAVEAVNDSNQLNDQSNTLNLVVQPDGVIIDPPTPVNARIPLDFYWKNSLYETILTEFNYCMHWLQNPCWITGLVFYNNFTSSTLASGKPIKIWLENVEQTNLAEGWIPSTELTLVFDGNVSFPFGQNTIFITFQQPFFYTGGNLALMVQRPMDTQYYDSSDYFKCYNLPNCSRKLYSDTITFDPANPAPCNLSNEYPAMTFFTSLNGIGSLSGTVRDNLNFALSGANVHIGATDISAVTDSMGAYNIPYIPAGNVSVSVSKPGYHTLTQNVTITNQNNTAQDFTLQPISSVTITGTVVNSAEPTLGLPNAEVVLNGTTQWTILTQANGNFTFTGVPANQTYSLHVSKPGYNDYNSTVQIGYTDLNLGSISLSVMTFPPVAVLAWANSQNTAFNISWQHSTQDTLSPIVGYKVWRLLPGQESNEELWTLLTPNAIWDTVFVDTGFQHPSLGIWSVLWAVRSVYVGNIHSAPAFSNGVVGGMPNGLLKGTVTNSDNHFPLFGVMIIINPGALTVQTDYNGHYEQVLMEGIYNLTAGLVNYTGASAEVIVAEGDTTTCDLALDLVEAIPDTPEVISETALKGCNPNPFSDRTIIRYSVKEPVFTTLEIYDLLGRKVRTLVSANSKSGDFTCQWNGTDNNGRRAANGIYFYRMTSGKYTATRKIILLK